MGLWGDKTAQSHCWKGMELSHRTISGYVVKLRLAGLPLGALTDMSLSRSLGQWDCLQTITGRDFRLCHRDFGFCSQIKVCWPVSGGAKRTCSHWVLGLIGLIRNHSQEKLEPSNETILESKVGLNVQKAFL